MELTASDVETIDACVVCGERRFTEISNVYSQAADTIVFATAYCGCCGSTFRNRRPRLSWFESRPASSFREIWDDAWEATRVFRYDHYQRHLRRYLRAGAAILDIGANTGVGPRFLESLGYQVFGVEQELKRAELARAMVGSPERIFAGSFEHYPVDRQFDGIMLVHVLEHLQTPRTLLAKLRSLLADDGVFYVEVPDLRTAVYYGDSFYLGHQSNFTRSSLTELLAECGFQVVEDVSRLHINADGTAVGLLCRKAEPRRPRWQPDASLDDVRRIYAYRYSRHHPSTYSVADLSSVQQLANSSFAFDATSGHYVCDDTRARLWVRLRPEQMARGVAREIALKLIARYAAVRYRGFLDEVKRTYSRLLADETRARPVAPLQSG